MPGNSSPKKLTKYEVIIDKKCYLCPCHAPVSPAVSDAEDDSVVALKGVDDVTCDPIPDNHLPKHSPGQNCHAPGLWAVQEAAVEDAGPALRHSTCISPDLGLVC